ncbi:MAG: histidine-type phosphatase [Candidatus Acidiferrales bacterium]
MGHSRLTTAILAALLAASAVAAAPPRLKYVVIISRHGVRSPTWDATRLNQYSSEPWPQWGVPPGNLTPHGRALILLMGAYYRDWLSGEYLLSRQGCKDAGRIYMWADTDQRTIETGRAFAESLLPGCELAVHSQPQGEKDHLFSGVGTPDPELALKAVRDRLAPDSEGLLSDLRPALVALQSILTGGKKATTMLTVSPAEINVSIRGKSVDLTEPFSAGSTLSEDLLLEYADGMRGTDLGWGRLTKENLFRALELHSVESDLVRRTPYLARARGSNLLAHVLESIEQAATGKSLPGALGHPGDRVLILCGHDTNLSNISGILGLSWHLEGYRPDDTPPGGALVFSLWRDPDSGQDFVRTQFVAQTLDQMRNVVRLTISHPPGEEDVSIPGCEPVGHDAACSWPRFESMVHHAIDPAFVSTDAAGRGDP